MTNTENTLLHKNPSTGHAAGHHEVVHLCHRCGWPFPNPHPSAKHRRAHKRVCGTIEGYAINQPKSDDDDEEHDSDDDNGHTPSPAPAPIEKKTNNAKESGISGVGQISIKSEDDVFSDAITEFSDGGSDKIVVENKSVQETVDKAHLNGSASTGLMSDSGATVDAKEHPEGVTLVAEPVSIEQCTELQTDVIKSEIPRDVAVEPVPVEQCTELQPDIIEPEIPRDVAVEPVSVKQCTELQPDVIESEIPRDVAVKPVFVEQCTELQPDDIKSEIPRDVAVDTNVQTGEDKLASVSLDSDEGKNSHHATEVVKHDTSDLTATVKEMVSSVIGYDLNGVSNKESKDNCSLEIVSDTPVAHVEDQTTGIIIEEDVNFADKSAHAEPLKSVSENGGGDATTSQEKVDPAIQLAPSTDSPCDLDSNEKPLEQVSKSEASVPECGDEDSKKPSEQTCEVQAKSGVHEVESVDIVGTAKELAPVITGSELLTESCGDEINVTSGGAGTSEPSLPIQKHSEDSPRIEKRAYEDASCEELTNDDNAVVSDFFSFTPQPSVSATVDDNGKVVGDDLKCLQDESDIKLTKENGGISKVDPYNHSTATSDSMEVNCGSVSETDFQETKTTSEKRDSKKSDDFEPPSFVTLVQNGEEDDKVHAASEIETVQNNQELKSDALQAAWFPSLTNVVNESEGRKKNEEKIAKVTNWSPGRQHGPLKNLLNDAKSPNTKQIPATDNKDEETVKNNGEVSTKANCGPDKEASKEMDKEWDSPARYPIETKKEKKKKGKTFWIPFACCSSVHREL